MDKTRIPTKVRVVGLRQKRETLGWSQRSLARILRISPLQLYRLERGLSGISVQSLFDLVDVLGSQTVERADKRYVVDRAARAAGGTE